MKTQRWYIQIHGFEEGPYSFDELKKDYRLHPTLPVRREEIDEWSPAIDDPLLAKLFKEERPNPFPKEEEVKRVIPEEGEVIVASSEPPYNFFLLLTALLILFYIFYRYYL